MRPWMVSVCRSAAPAKRVLPRSTRYFVSRLALRRRECLRKPVEGDGQLVALFFAIMFRLRSRWIA